MTPERRARAVEFLRSFADDVLREAADALAAMGEAPHPFTPYRVDSEVCKVCEGKRSDHAPKSAEASMKERIEAFEKFARKVAVARVHVGHDGDEESGQHDADCEGCVLDCLQAEASHLLDGPSDPDRDCETTDDLVRL